MDSYLCDAKWASSSCRRDEVQDPSTGYGSQTLSQHVEDRLRQAQLSGHHHGRGDGRVDVSAADVAETLHHGGDAQAEAQGDEDQVGRGRLLLPRLPADGGAQTEEDEDEGGQVFSRHGPPEVLGPDAFESHHDAVTVTTMQEPPGKKRQQHSSQGQH